MVTIPGQPDLGNALDKLWKQFLPQMIERIDVIDAAVAALAAGGLTVDQRASANSAAHKLAGVLGTFGLTRGTVLAREAEMLFSSESETCEELLPVLQKLAARLREIVNSRK
jgi:HPt (histidine-containing phosphotransfer) domain-containing protein